MIDLDLHDVLLRLPRRLGRRLLRVRRAQHQGAQARLGERTLPLAVLLIIGRGSSGEARTEIPTGLFKLTGVLN